MCWFLVTADHRWLPDHVNIKMFVLITSFYQWCETSICQTLTGMKSNLTELSHYWTFKSSMTCHIIHEWLHGTWSMYSIIMKMFEICSKLILSYLFRMAHLPMWTWTIRHRYELLIFKSTEVRLLLVEWQRTHFLFHFGEMLVPCNLKRSNRRAWMINFYTAPGWRIGLMSLSNDAHVDVHFK